MSRNIWLIALFLIGLFVSTYYIADYAISSKKDVEICYSGNESKIDTCVNALAQSNGWTVCKHVRVDMRSDCILYAAIGRDRSAICKKLGNEKDIDTCYGKVALTNEDRGPLKYIEDVKERELWLSKIAQRYNESDYCRYITNVQTFGKCMFEVAKVTGNPSHCQSIEDTSLYRDECFMELAIINHDSSLCEKMHSIKKTQCISKTS